MRRAILGVLAGLASLLWVETAGGEEAAREPQLFDVRVDETIGAAPAGRLLIFAQPWELLAERFPNRRIPDWFPILLQIDAAAGAPYHTAVAAQEIEGIAPGQIQTVDADQIASPMPFSNLPQGDFAVQALLDVDHNLRRSAGDLAGPVLLMRLPGARQTLVLDKIERWPDPWNRPEPEPRPAWLPPPPPSQPNPASVLALEEARQWREAAKTRTERASFQSPAMTAFLGRPAHIRAHILTPPEYERNTDRYPVVYAIQQTLLPYESDASVVERTYEMMAKSQLPPMIWVFLDQRSAAGPHMFADSANNGPWGRALTEEFIPWLEARYRADGEASGRFVRGRTEGAWSALWLQTRYPKLFGGAWAMEPYPADFRSFFNVDLYRQTNAYHRVDGTPTPMRRSLYGLVATFREYARAERALGPVGGRTASFEWIFSPRDVAGKPRPLFDRDTGAIDPQVAAHWRDYDIARRIRENWPELKPDLDGKIHLSIGVLDPDYLDRPARGLKATLDQLGARSDFRFIGGAGDINVIDVDPLAVDKMDAWQMYAIARPDIPTPPLTPVKPRFVTITTPGTEASLPLPISPLQPKGPRP